MPAGDQQQQQQSALKESGSVKKQVYKYQSQNDGGTAGLCPKCNAELPADAVFCPECGSSSGHVCAKCGKTNPPSSDICQYCHAWLLEGKCKFCYSPVDVEDAFCSECGKPKDGITCPKCRQLSIFDFCKHCGVPVTKEALEEVQAAQNEIKTAAAFASASSPVAPKPAAPIAEPQTVVDSEDDLSSRRIRRADRKVNPQKVVEEKEEVLASLEDAKARAMENAYKKFSTPQAARRWHIARRHPDALGWLCNYAGCVHLYAEGGPDDCHDPSRGGCDFFGTMDDIFMNEFGWYKPKNK